MKIEGIDMKKKSFLSLFVLAALASASAAWAGTCTINATQTNQYIHCIGASSAWSGINGLGTELFADDNVNGHIGLQSLRARIDPTNNFSPEVSTLVSAKAVNPNILFWATEWSPPAQYKANDNVDGGASNDTFLGASSGAANSDDTGLASYQVSFIQYCKNQGINLYALSVQNEPNFNPTYEACLWSAGQFDVYVKAFYSALQSAGLSTKIMIPEPDNPGGMNLASTAMADSTAAPEIGIIASHAYGENLAPLSSYGFSNVTNQEWWESEISGNTTDVPGALQEAGWIHTSLVDAGTNAFHYWWIQDLYSGSSLDIKAFVLGNYSKFIRPGYYRMGATEVPSSGVSVSAFKNTNTSSPQTIVFVAINSNGSSVNQTFTISGVNVTSVTPWVTNGSTNLVAQPAVAVSGGSFTYSLTPSSVTSFVGVVSGTVANTPTFTPVPPTATHTNTPVPPTATFTHTNTPVPPTATFTFTATSTATKTNTPVPPTATATFTATHTNTPVPPTNTFTAVPPTPTQTNTPVPPTATNTALPPTLTNTPAPPTATNTAAPPTSTFTAAPPTATFTFTLTPLPPTVTNTPLPATATNTALPPTSTPTFTSVPPTSTFTHTPVPPTNTFTAVPPTVTPTFTLTPVPPTPTDTIVVSGGSFEVQLLSAVTSANTNSPHPQIQIVNTGTGSLNLNNVTVRYWFNCDCTTQSLQAWVDWAGLIPQGTSETGNVHISVLPTSLGGQTDYVLYSFTGNIVLPPGGILQIQSRFNKSDWSNMNQSNDWSFAPYTSFTNAQDVTGYLNGSLVWGQQPAATNAAALTASSALAFPNPSTGNGTTLSFTLGGNSTGVRAADLGSSAIVDPNAKITLGIYTLAGRLIWSQTLTGGGYGSTGQHDVYWNEKDLRGSGLANGVYLLKVTVQSNGQTSSTIAKILILG